jgi:aminoglycoside phosphotransferase (APT) family kinase protein
MSYVDMRGMPSRTRCSTHYAEVSGRQVDDLDYYLVLAKWKLAIVLEQGFHAQVTTRSCSPTDRHRRPDASAADLAESSDYA